MKARKPGNIAIFLLLAAAVGLALLLFFLGGENGDGRFFSATGRDPVADEGASGGIGPEEGDGLLYEEDPHTGFEDRINQVDYAISQTIQRLSMPVSDLRITLAELREQGGHSYQFKGMDIYNIESVPVFAQALRDSLLAWSERATLERLSEEAAALLGVGARQHTPESAGTYWLITLDGVPTHLLFLSTEGAREPKPEGPRLVIVIDDIGESMARAKRLLALDFPITMAVWPRGTHAVAAARLAHESGAEVIIHQPMEPEGYPKVNPGDGVILRGMGEAEIRALLADSITRVPFATGMNNHMGSRLTQNEEAMRVVCAVLRERGFYMLDSLTHPKSRFAATAVRAGGPAFKRDIFLDVDASKDKVLAQLRKAERMALVKGQAIAIGHPLPGTLAALEEWQSVRDKGINVVRLKDLTPLGSASNSLP